MKALGEPYEENLTHGSMRARDSCGMGRARLSDRRAEGVQTFFAPDAKIEAVDAPARSRGAEGCKVLSIDPMRSFAFDWSRK